MKKKFSTKWTGSSQPRKQRKYSANAPLHLKRKLLSVNLAKDLRKKYGTRNIVVRKGDTVLVMRGKYSKTKGKVSEVKIKMGKVYVENVQNKKKDGSKVNVPMKASNLQIIELNLDDSKRAQKLGVNATPKVEVKEEKKKETKDKTKETKKEESKIKDKEKAPKGVPSEKSK